MRTTPYALQVVKLEISRFPYKERLCMPGSLTAPGRQGTRDNAPRRAAFRVWKRVGTRNMSLSRLNGWPTHSPVNASPTPSRAPAHDLGPMRLATPSSQWTLTTYSLPVSRRTPNKIYPGQRIEHADKPQRVASHRPDSTSGSAARPARPTYASPRALPCGPPYLIEIIANSVSLAATRRRPRRTT